MGANPWSPKLQVLHNTIFLWKLIIKKKKRWKMSFCLLHCTGKKADIYNPIAISLEQALQAKLEAIKAYHVGQTHASKCQKEHSITLAEAKAKKKGIMTENKQKSRVHSEN
jgi:hypothetical protein